MSEYLSDQVFNFFIVQHELKPRSFRKSSLCQMTFYFFDLALQESRVHIPAARTQIFGFSFRRSLSSFTTRCFAPDTNKGNR